jgi:hypothetical protein
LIDRILATAFCAFALFKQGSDLPLPFSQLLFNSLPFFAGKLAHDAVLRIDVAT